jgi:hypothetical protein
VVRKTEDIMTWGSILEHPDIDPDRSAVLSRDERALLVERILASPDFVRSPQLAKFLLYICTALFEGRSQTLSEQHIGVAVFGRAPDYDSSADTIVRSHALRLRRRLEQYFQRAGKREPIHILIPRGGYVPIFVSASEIAPSAPEVPTSDASPSTPSHAPLDAPAISVEVAARLPAPRRRSAAYNKLLWRYRLITASLVLLCVCLSVSFVLHLRTHAPIKRNHLLWGRLFTNDQPTQIVLGDSGLVLFHAFARRPVSLHDYLSDDFRKQMPFVEHIDPDKALFLLHRRYTSMVDATAITHILRLPEAIPERTLVHYSRDMHLNDFKTGNVILIGAQEAVPWVELFESHMDFFFSIDNADHHSSFLNRHPLPGELEEYSSINPANSGKVYAGVAFLPNLSATGNVLILEGLSMAGTEAAVDLMMDDDRLLPILNKIRRPDGSLPHFEMLLESEALGESAGPARVVALHLHK